jgi:hypothetical protein
MCIVASEVPPTSYQLAPQPGVQGSCAPGPCVLGMLRSDPCQGRGAFINQWRAAHTHVSRLQVLSTASRQSAEHAHTCCAEP